MRLSNGLSRLFDASRSRVQVEAEFIVPPFLNRLGAILSILASESPMYKLYSVCIFLLHLHTVYSYGYLQENCYFFCAAIYENLVPTENSDDVARALNKFTMLFALRVKARIKGLMDNGPLVSPSPVFLN